MNTQPITAPDLLGLIFIALKLMDYIDWSWWWILAPFWLMFVITLATELINMLLKPKR